MKTICYLVNFKTIIESVLEVKMTNCPLRYYLRCKAFKKYFLFPGEKSEATGVQQPESVSETEQLIDYLRV